MVSGIRLMDSEKEDAWEVAGLIKVSISWVLPTPFRTVAEATDTPAGAGLGVCSGCIPEALRAAASDNLLFITGSLASLSYCDSEPFGHQQNNE